MTRFGAAGVLEGSPAVCYTALGDGKRAGSRSPLRRRRTFSSRPREVLQGSAVGRGSRTHPWLRIKNGPHPSRADTRSTISREAGLEHGEKILRCAQDDEEDEGAPLSRLRRQLPWQGSPVGVIEPMHRIRTLNDPKKRTVSIQQQKTITKRQSKRTKLVEQPAQNDYNGIIQ